MKHWLWMMVLVTVAQAQRQPVITGYGNRDCVAPGSELVIQGTGFGDQRGDLQVVLWEAGQSTDLAVVVWRETEVTVRVPRDRRVVPGRQYVVRIERWGGQLVGNFGPPVTICAAAPAEGAGQTRARQLAQAVFRANGGEQWRQVNRIRFTFHVAQGDKALLQAAHDWDVAAGTATVAWDNKQVTVNLRRPGADADARAAHARWVNDTYWLLAPLKLLDAGVQLHYVGTRVVEGKQYEVVRTTYEQVGLTPGDRYHFYIDPTTYRVAYWDYQPDTPRAVSGTWEKYEKFGPLLLSTEHKFGDKRIWFTDVAVQ